MHNLPNEVEEQLVMGLMNRLLEESALRADIPFINYWLLSCSAVPLGLDIMNHIVCHPA
jgi:hypothetical protein